MFFFDEFESVLGISLAFLTRRLKLFDDFFVLLLLLDFFLGVAVVAEAEESLEDILLPQCLSSK